MIRAALLVALAACGRFDIAEVADAARDTPSGCPHTFCDYFDRPSPILGNWTTSVVTGGALALDSGMLAVDVASPITGVVYLSKDLPVATTSIHVEADVEFDTSNNGEIDLIQIRWLDLPPPCTSFGLYLVRDKTGPVVIQETYGNCGGPANNNDNLASLPSTAPSGLQHVTIDVTLGALGVAHVRVQIGSSLDLDKQLTSYALPPSAINIHLGAPGVMLTTGPWQVRYDSLVVDLQ